MTGGDEELTADHPIIHVRCADSLFSRQPTDAKGSQWDLPTFISHFTACHKLKRADEVEKSVCTLENLIGAFPNNIHLLLELAQTHCTSGKFRDAVSCFQHARWGQER